MEGGREGVRQEQREGGREGGEAGTKGERRESGKSSGSRSRENYMYITYTECRHMYLSQLQTLYCIHAGEHIMSLHTTAQCTHSCTLHTCVFYCTVHHCAYDGTEYTQGSHRE